MLFRSIKIILSILRPLELLVGRARAVLDKRSAHDRVLEESGGGVLVQQSFQQWKKLSWTFLTLTSPNISSWPSCTWTRQVRLVAIKGRLDRKRATVSWPEHKKKKRSQTAGVSARLCKGGNVSARHPASVTSAPRGLRGAGVHIGVVVRLLKDLETTEDPWVWTRRRRT